MLPRNGLMKKNVEYIVKICEAMAEDNEIQLV
jgi:hypothetical protein